MSEEERQRSEERRRDREGLQKCKQELFLEMEQIEKDIFDPFSSFFSLSKYFFLSLSIFLCHALSEFFFLFLFQYFSLLFFFSLSTISFINHVSKSQKFFPSGITNELPLSLVLTNFFSLFPSFFLSFFPSLSLSLSLSIFSLFFLYFFQCSRNLLSIFSLPLFLLSPPSNNLLSEKVRKDETFINYTFRYRYN